MRRKSIFMCISNWDTKNNLVYKSIIVQINATELSLLLASLVLTLCYPSAFDKNIINTFYWKIVGFVEMGWGSWPFTSRWSTRADWRTTRASWHRRRRRQHVRCGSSVAPCSCGISPDPPCPTAAAEHTHTTQLESYSFGTRTGIGIGVPIFHIVFVARTLLITIESNRYSYS